MTGVPVHLEAVKPESATLRRAFHRAGITTRADGDLAADLQCWLSGFKTGIFDHLTVSLTHVSQFSPITDEGCWPAECDAAFLVNGMAYQRSFTPAFMEWGRQFPGSARRLLAILGHASRRTIPIILPDDLLDIAINYYWSGESDETTNLEQLKEEGGDPSDIFTRAQFDASFPDWTTTHQGPKGADPTLPGGLHDHHPAVSPVKSVVDALQELVLDQDHRHTGYINFRNDFEPCCRSGGAFLLRTSRADCAELLYDEAMQCDANAGADTDVLTAIPVNTRDEAAIIGSLEKLWLALRTAEQMALVLELISEE